MMCEKAVKAVCDRVQVIPSLAHRWVIEKIAFSIYPGAETFDGTIADLCDKFTIPRATAYDAIRAGIEAGILERAEGGLGVVFSEDFDPVSGPEPVRNSDTLPETGVRNADKTVRSSDKHVRNSETHYIQKEVKEKKGASASADALMRAKVRAHILKMEAGQASKCPDCGRVHYPGDENDIRYCEMAKPETREWAFAELPILN